MNSIMTIHGTRTWAAAISVAASLSAVAAQAQEGVLKESISGRFTLNLADPEAHLPSTAEANKYPLDWGYLLMELDERAIAARKQNDWKSAIKFHRATAKLVPDRAISFAHLCTDYEKAGQRTEAVTSCFKALNLEGSKLEYFTHFIRLVADRPGGVDAKEVTDAKAAIEHLKGEPTARSLGYELQCELSLSTHDDAALAECSKELRQVYPHTLKPTSFAWTLALRRGDFTLARKLLKDAKRDGMDKAVLDTMERATRAAEKGEPLELAVQRDAGVQAASAAPAAGNGSGSGPEQARPADSKAAAIPAAAPSSGATAQASADGSSTALASQGMHPMLRWLVGLVVALLIAIPVARRFMRTSA